MSIKYSIIMPYLNRAGQLYSTLSSFEHHYHSRNDYEVLIMEDIKNAKGGFHKSLIDVIHHFSRKVRINIFTVTKETFTPCPMYNAGAHLANGKFLLLTSPECFHKNNILFGIDSEVDSSPDNYIVCACESTRDGKLFADYSDFTYSFKRWFQHSKYRDACYHFCSVISKENYFKVGGFDEKYNLGIAFDDDDFRDRVKNSGIKFVMRDDLITVHIQHDKVMSLIGKHKYMKLWKRNRDHYGSDGNG